MYSEIKAFSCYLPQKVVRTVDFAPIGTIPRKIDLKRLTKIDSHHEASPGESSITMACDAAKIAIERSGIEPSEIDLVIFCGVSKMNEQLQQQISPSMASTICKELGLNSRSFDVSNACSGMVTGLMIASAQVRNGMCRNALVVSGEFLTPVLKEALSKNLIIHKKAIPSLTVGDAGAAYIIGKSEKERMNIFDPITLSKYDDLCIAEAAKGMSGPQMRTDGKNLQNGILDNLGEYLKKNISQEKWDSYSHVISHQTTPRAVGKGADIAGSVFGHSEIVRSVSHSGNTASTTHGVVLEDLISMNKLQSGQNVLLLAFGSGLSMVGLEFVVPSGVEAW